MAGSKRVKVNKKLIGKTNVAKYKSVHHMNNPEGATGGVL